MNDTDWKESGSCNPDAPVNYLPSDAWWPEGGRIRDDNIAAAVECRRCPVLVECRQWVAEADPIHGVVAGEIRVASFTFTGANRNKTCATCGTRNHIRMFPLHVKPGQERGRTSAECWGCEVNHAA